jgi:hypothetical protein
MVPAPVWPDNPSLEAQPYPWELPLIGVFLVVGFASFFLGRYGRGFWWLGRDRERRARRRGGIDGMLEENRAQTRREMAPLLLFLACTLAAVGVGKLGEIIHEHRIEAYEDASREIDTEVCRELLSMHGLEIERQCFLPYEGARSKNNAVFPDGSVVRCELYQRDGWIGLDCPVELPK